MDRALRLHREGDHEQALLLLEPLLETSPRCPEAVQLSERCRHALERECLAAIGGEECVLVATAPPEDWKRFALDTKSGFLLSVLAAATRLEDVLDIAGLSRLDALRRVRDLMKKGLVAVAPLRLRALVVGRLNRP